MKKLLLILFVFALPSISFAQEVIVSTEPGPSPKSWLAADIFYRGAGICPQPTTTFPCVTDHVVSTGGPGPFYASISLFLPISQAYTRFYIFTDIEGNVVPGGLQSFTTTLTGPGTTHIAQSFTLPAGLYKFISITSGADGRLAISDPFRFRVCC